MVHESRKLRHRDTVAADEIFWILDARREARTCDYFLSIERRGVSVGVGGGSPATILSWNPARETGRRWFTLSRW
jgi:hypothetical protein